MRHSKPCIKDAVVILLLVLSWLGFTTATSRLAKIERPFASDEMQTALPLFMQVLLAGGDRFLATNISVFRALTVETENKEASRFAVQAKVQQDAAWLNPYHEDNYYLAAASLSWNDRVYEAQQILKLASDARSFDPLPPFFYAFNEFYFRHDPVHGSEWLQIAANHSQTVDEKLNLNRLAGAWLTKGQDRHQALRMLESLAKQSRYGSLRRQLLQRSEQVRQLISLDDASASYKKRYGRPPKNLEDLVNSEILDQLPIDPMGAGYILDAQGIAQIKVPQKK